MGKYGPKPISQLIKDDVDRVRTGAKFIIDISNSSPEIIKNDSPFIGVIAIIGPGKSAFGEFKEANLCEIGLGKSRPYHSGVKPRGFAEKTGGIKTFVKRRKWFLLTEKQYRVVAPVVFKFLQELVDERVAQWKCNPHTNPFFVKGQKMFYAKRNKSVVIYKTCRVARNGLRFSVDLKDAYFVSDIFHSEIYLNDNIKNHLGGLARFIDKRLSIYRNNGHRADFSKLKGAKDIIDNIESQQISKRKYLLAEMLTRYFPKGIKNPLWDEICKLLGFNGEKFWQKNIADLALPNPETRLCDTQIVVEKDQKEYIVFEIMPTRIGTLPF